MAVRIALQVHTPHRYGHEGAADACPRRYPGRRSCGSHWTDESIVEVLCADPALATAAFRAADLLVEEVEVAVAWLPDVPACLAETCETLVAAGIRVRSACVIAVESERGQYVMIESPDAQRADQFLWALRY